MTDDTAPALADVEVSARLRKMIEDHPLPDGVPDADVSADEMAQALGVTTNTLTKWLKSVESGEEPFPVVERGGMGKPYVLRLSHGYAWKMQRDADQAARAKHNSRAVSLLQASFLGDVLDKNQSSLSAKDRKALAEADFAYSKAAQMRRQLVSLEEVVDMVESVFKIVRNGLESMPDRLERELHLKAEEVDQVERVASDILEGMVERIEAAELEERDISEVEVTNRLVI
jgi:phage terminase Nu1 subunit (DNA packaging protein)